MISYTPKELRFIDWNQMSYSLEWIYEGSPPRTGRSGVHHFAGLSAWLVRRGSVSMESGGVRIEAREGEWVFPPYHDDERVFSQDLVILSLRFRASWGGDNELFQEAIPRVCPAHTYPRLEKLAVRLLKTVGTQVSFKKNEMMTVPIGIDQHMKVYGAFIAWLGEYCRVMHRIGAELHKVSIVDERVQEAKNYLDTVSLKMDFREETVARHIGLSIAQLNRIFIRDVGVRPAAYFRERRLSHAKRLLLDTPMAVKQVGYELGFNDPANFTNWFRGHMRLTPGQFRKQAMTTK